MTRNNSTTKREAIWKDKPDIESAIVDLLINHRSMKVFTSFLSRVWKFIACLAGYSQLFTAYSRDFGSGVSWRDDQFVCRLTSLTEHVGRHMLFGYGGIQQEKNRMRTRTASFLVFWFWQSCFWSKSQHRSGTLYARSITTLALFQSDRRRRMW